jgi:two-component system, cell cycle sensor histidine kinase and response regulator CckA
VLDDAYASEHIDVTPGPYVVLEIADTGKGMDTETSARIFEPFFTTKETGTGLGLATLYGIVKQSGGHIWLYSEPGLGTTFRVYLPQTDEPLARQEASPRHAGPVVGDETVLVVEDAEIVRPVVAELLGSFGYTVLTAADGVEALAVAEGHEGTIDLLLTDVVMPRMNGRELAVQLTDERPDMKVIFTSGYPSDTVVRTGITEARVAYIQKPYVGDDLLRMIRTTLDGDG